MSETFVPITRIHKNYDFATRSATHVMIAESLRNRKPHCKANCNSKEGGCDTCKTPKKDEKLPTNKDVQIVEIAFKGYRKVLSTVKFPVALNDYVIVLSETGLEYGRINSVGIIAESKIDETIVKEEIPNIIIRIANQEDLVKIEEIKQSEREIVTQAKNYSRECNLEIKVTDAEWQFDKKRLTVYFTSPQRVDFRELVKLLANNYKARIELRQISSREEATRVGDIGPCGQALCCTSFLQEYPQVTIDFAKTQQLPTNNVTRLSGMCGRLKCCLLYEMQNYVDALKNYPPLDATIQTEQGAAKIIKVDVFKDTMLVYVFSSDSFVTLSLEEVQKLMKDGKVSIPAQTEERYTER
jgi:cell fate regulator YaaT (PSP1 superfamily)